MFVRAGDFHCHCEGGSELSGQEPVLSANLSHHNFEFDIRSDIHSRILLASDPHRGKFLAYILTYYLASILFFYLTPYLHAILY